MILMKRLLIALACCALVCMDMRAEVLSYEMSATRDECVAEYAGNMYYGMFYKLVF